MYTDYTIHTHLIHTLYVCICVYAHMCSPILIQDLIYSRLALELTYSHGWPWTSSICLSNAGITSVCHRAQVLQCSPALLVWTQDSLYAGQALYQLSYIPSPLWVSCYDFHTLFSLSFLFRVNSVNGVKMHRCLSFFSAVLYFPCVLTGRCNFSLSHSKGWHQVVVTRVLLLTTPVCSLAHAVKTTSSIHLCYWVLCACAVWVKMWLHFGLNPRESQSRERGSFVVRCVCTVPHRRENWRNSW